MASGQLLFCNLGVGGGGGGGEGGEGSTAVLIGCTCFQPGGVAVEEVEEHEPAEVHRVPQQTRQNPPYLQTQGETALTTLPWVTTTHIGLHNQSFRLTVLLGYCSDFVVVVFFKCFWHYNVVCIWVG